jgi:hypothetical protein
MPKLPTPPSHLTSALRIGAVAVALLAAAAPLQAATVNIPDANLRAALETRLGKAPGEPIDSTEMETLTFLSLNNLGIADLTGLETALNLEILQIRLNAITDLGPLAGLTGIRLLEADDNQISDVSPLAGLVALHDLFLSANQISDVSDLATLTGLERLFLLDNAISDISALSGLTGLTDLNLNNNPVQDLSALAGMSSLTNLFLVNNQLTDISQLAGLTTLKQLWLNDNSLSDISVLANLTALTQLYLAGNLIQDISAIAGIGTLENVDLRNNFLDLDPSSDDWAVITQLQLHATVLSSPQNALPDTNTYAGWVAFWEIPSGQDGEEDANGPLAFPNIIAFSMGLNPFAAVENQVPAVLKNGSQYTFTYLRNLNAEGIVRTIETSTSLSGWTPTAPDAENILSDNGGQQLVEAVFNSAGDRLFFRLRVEVEAPEPL